MESERYRIPEPGKTPAPMRKGGTQIWFDTPTQTQTEPLEQSQQDLLSPSSTETADDAGDVDHTLPPPPTNMENFQSVVAVDEGCEEYAQDNFPLPERATMGFLYGNNNDGAYASGVDGPGAPITELGLRIGIEEFDGVDLDMSGFNVAYEAQINLQAPDHVVDHHFPNLVVNSNNANDLDEGRIEMEMEMEMMMSFPPALEAGDWDFISPEDLLSMTNWHWNSPPYDMLDVPRVPLFHD